MHLAYHLPGRWPLMLSPDVVGSRLPILHSDECYPYIYIQAACPIDTIYESDVGYEPLTYMIDVVHCVTVDVFGMPLLRSVRIAGLN